jgi:3-oxoacyl-[acyl-carrier-protein] synthase III
MKLSRDKIIRCLETHDFSYYEETKKSLCFRKGTSRVYVPKLNQLAPQAARAILWSAGLTKEEIDAFIRASMA